MKIDTVGVFSSPGLAEEPQPDRGRDLEGAFPCLIPGDLPVQHNNALPEDEHSGV